MEDGQFIGLDWNVVIRGAVETLVMLTAGVWLLTKASRGPVAIFGATAALLYAVLFGALTFGSAQTTWSGTQPTWLTTVYTHSAATDWTRVLCLLVVVITFMNVRRRAATPA